ncbi:MAG: CPBP family intramembrane glutamic endopeptidase [Gallionellaceae bacterium]
MMNLIQKSPVLSYFVLTFLISWGLILVLIALNGMPVTVPEAQEQLPLTIMVFLSGPLCAGLLMIGLADGREGFRNLLSRILKWRVGWVWYAVALLTAPLVFAVVHYLLASVSPVYVPGFMGPNGTTLVLMSVLSGIMVGICEEIGWFGFAIPRLRLRYNILTTGLLVGVIWGAWHIMANDIWAIRTYSGGLDPVVYAVLAGISFLIGQLPPYRVLMVWVYEKTGSLLVMMVMHFSLTACSIACSPAAMSGWQVFIYSLSVAAAMWLIAGAVVWSERRVILGPQINGVRLD